MNLKRILLPVLLVSSLVLSVGFIGDVIAGEKNPCAKNPCSAKNPCVAKNPCAAAGPLECPKGAKAEACTHNMEGIKHFNHTHAGHFEEAAKHFAEAIKVDPNLAEAHYNLGLALHNQGKHAEATEHFKTAAKLAPKNEMIQRSEILKQHLGKNPCGMKQPCGKK